MAKESFDTIEEAIAEIAADGWLLLLMMKIGKMKGFDLGSRKGDTRGHQLYGSPCSWSDLCSYDRRALG